MKILKFLALFILAIALFGCTSLEYTGEDYKVENTQTIKTAEDFVFNTYKKDIDGANIKIGISKTPVQEILALYVQVENLNYETPYTFRVDDLRLYDSNGEIQFITSNNYLSIYQTQESSAMGAMSSMGATFQNISGMTANYNEINQTMVQNASQQSNQDAFSKMEDLGNRILKHTIRTSSTISPRKAQYFYFFFENKDNFPINVKYKSLNYQFRL